MAVTAQEVKELRDRTGAGMMDCKAALEETQGDMEKAIDWLREKGVAKAAKKAGRVAAEGLIGISINGNNASIVEINTETDFVAKNPDFQKYVQDVANEALKASSNDLDGFMNQNWQDSSKSVSDVLTEQVATIGEKITIRRIEKVDASNGLAVSYLHNGGKIGVIVNAETSDNSDAAKEALSNIAMQVAAMNPKYVGQQDIPQEEMSKMREITIESALNDPASLPKPIQNELYAKVEAEKLFSDEDLAILAEKKNDKYLYNFLSEEAIAKLAELAVAGKADIVENKIFTGLVDGRMKKQLQEVSLLDQVYVKAEDGKQTVGNYVEQEAKKLGTNMKVVSFVRYEAGEGIEKRQEDFAEEVAKQMNQNK
ncbi:MAG: translation elongation factor Ts [Clostridia bacterium]|nr:translation elongation factor Ts [Clostridia bacterium]